MNKNLPQDYFGRLCRAIIEFDMIQKGDKILIGLSGGKDSLFLTYALSILRSRSATPFEIAVLTIDPMFNDTFDTSELAEFCTNLNIPFYTKKVDIAGIIEKNNGDDPCFTCAFFRRGAINKFAVENGFNKVAYAHHHDDAVETFLMSILYSGQINTFLPTTYLDQSNLTVIRPLVYFREFELKETPNLHGFIPIPSPCPMNGLTKRQEAKELIKDLEKNNSALYAHLGAAMRGSPTSTLWPAELTREELYIKHLHFWNKKVTK
ncbi:MAG: PP-loop domain protein [Firmicutes bacterium]|nr:PP-loop domain protein [Bacillota bacterium]